MSLHTICPTCKSKNIKLLETKVEKIKYRCLECNKEFESFPTQDIKEEFNG